MKITESKIGKTLLDKDAPMRISLDDLFEMYPESIKLDGFDNCIVGVDTDGRYIYSMFRMVEQLMTADGMDEDEAYDYISYNTIRALPYAGDGAPIIVDICVDPEM